MENFYFLKKKELSQLNAKERREYISTQKRYSKFQIAINTGMLKLHPDKSEFNPPGHRSDFHYLREVYSRVKKGVARIFEYYKNRLSLNFID